MIWQENNSLEYSNMTWEEWSGMSITAGTTVPVSVEIMVLDDIVVKQVLGGFR